MQHNFANYIYFVTEPTQMQNGYMFIQCVFYYSLMYTQCNLDKILNSVTEAVFWCINLPVWLFFHCVKTAFGSQKNLIKRRKKWNFQKLTYYIALNIKYYSSYIYLVVYCYLPTLFISSKKVQLFGSISNQNKLYNQT